MAISLSVAPPRLAFSRRPIKVQVVTDALNPTRLSRITLAFSAATLPLNGQNFTVTWAGVAVTFSFKTAPNANGTDLPLSEPNQSFSEYLGILTAILRRHYQIVADWNVYMTPTTIQLVAKTPDLYSPLLTTFMTNMVVTTTSVAPPSLRLSAYLRIADETETPFAAPLNAPFDAATARLEFDLQSAFADLTPHLPAPVSLDINNNYQREDATNAYRRYRIWAAEQLGSVPQATNVYGDFYAIHGFERDFSLDASNDRVIVLHKNTILRKPLTDKQPEYAYIWSLQNWTRCYVEVTITLNTGQTIVVLPNLGQNFAFPEDKLFCFKTGFEQLGLQTFPNINANDIICFDWRLYHDNSTYIGFEPETLLATMRYDVRRECGDHNFYILLDNGCGGMETLLLRGATALTFATDFVVTQTSDGTQRANNKGITRSVSVTTDTILTELAYYYVRLLRGNIFLCDVKNRKFIPIVCATKEIAINPRAPYNSLKFEFQYAEKWLS